MATTKSKKKMTPAEKAAARVPEPAPVPPAPIEPLPVDKHERRNSFLLLLGAVLFLLLLSAILYLGNYSHETDNARAALTATEQTAVEDKSDWIAFGDPSAETGIVFYPGGKVVAEAYAPLMHELADQGLFCVVAKMPFNLPFFKIDAASAVLDAYPNVGTWYAGGHSLGGLTVCQWAADNSSRISGIILLGAYTSVDLSGTNLRMLQIYGTNDNVMNRDNLAESQSLMPADSQVVELQGGNHAQFGDYGSQDGDGEAEISGEEQRKQTEDAILDWIAKE